MMSATLHTRFAKVFVSLLGAALLTTVAGTNILVLLLLLTAPLAWAHYRLEAGQRKSTFQFFGLIAAICVWDMVSNLAAGHGLAQAAQAVLHDMRTFGFIALLWPVFANASVSRTALWALLLSVVALATTNLMLTVGGYLSAGQYFWPTAPHLYGQVLVGLFFLLAQIGLVHPRWSWRVAIPMLLLLLLLSLFLASERRTGYLQLAAGCVVWFGLNYKRLALGRYRWWWVGAAVAALAVALASPIVQRRMLQVGFELQQFLNQAPAERTTTHTSIGIRLQYYLSVWTLIQQSNVWIGVGTLDFQDLFWKVNQQMGATDSTLFRNPHNEYLYMLATKGVIGLALYVAIFAQACRMAWQKKDEVQRVGLVMFVFLFMLSITTNSMMIDMEEGHFTLLILLIFLAPVSLDLGKAKTKQQRISE